MLLHRTDAAAVFFDARRDFCAWLCAISAVYIQWTKKNIHHKERLRITPLDTNWKKGFNTDTVLTCLKDMFRRCKSFKLLSAKKDWLADLRFDAFETIVSHRRLRKTWSVFTMWYYKWYMTTAASLKSWNQPGIPMATMIDDGSNHTKRVIADGTDKRLSAFCGDLSVKQYSRLWLIIPSNWLDCEEWKEIVQRLMGSWKVEMRKFIEIDFIDFGLRTIV